MALVRKCGKALTGVESMVVVHGDDPVDEFASHFRRDDHCRVAAWNGHALHGFETIR